MERIELTKAQKAQVIRELYCSETNQAIVEALLHVLISGETLYAAEKAYDLPKNSLAKKCKRVRDTIKMIETVINTK